MARVPLDAPRGIQVAVEELNDEMSRLKAAFISSSIDLRNATLPVESLQKDVAFLKQLRRIPDRGQRLVAATTPLYLDDTLGWSSVFGSVPSTSVSSNYTVLGGDFIILVDCTSGNVTVTLPLAILKKGRMLEIKKIDSTVNKVIIAASGSDLIDGFATQELLSQYEAVPISSDGVSNWEVL